MNRNGTTKIVAGAATKLLICIALDDIKSSEMKRMITKVIFIFAQNVVPLTECGGPRAFIRESAHPD